MFAVPENTIALTPARRSAHPARIALDVAADRGRWAALLRYDPDQRFSALVEATDEVEIWLLSWLPGQRTDLHDHGSTSGAFAVVSGALTEWSRRPDMPETAHTVSPGQARVFGPGYVHEVRNDGGDPAISIHVYRPQRTHRSLG
ncbi:MAG TPA: cysteine dioxygenase family protein [Pseudonocardiaceae bacterium]|nr:cysteine dioxygenase family protein [Pseudonocardiaceae bacterium]